MNFKIISTTLILFCVSNCGFQPIYQKPPEESRINYEDRLAAIKISTKRKRIDQKLRDNLGKVLNPNKIRIEKKYLLSIDLDKSTIGTFINPTGSVGRNKVTLTVNYKLIRIADNETISTGSISAKDDFNVEEKRFANYITEEEMELNLTQLIAQNIRNSLINDLILEVIPF